MGPAKAVAPGGWTYKYQRLSVPRAGSFHPQPLEPARPLKNPTIRRRVTQSPITALGNCQAIPPSHGINLPMTPIFHISWAYGVKSPDLVFTHGKGFQMDRLPVLQNQPGPVSFDKIFSIPVRPHQQNRPSSTPNHCKISRHIQSLRIMGPSSGFVFKEIVYFQTIVSHLVAGPPKSVIDWNSYSHISAVFVTSGLSILSDFFTLSLGPLITKWRILWYVLNIIYSF